MVICVHVLWVDDRRDQLRHLVRRLEKLLAQEIPVLAAVKRPAVGDLKIEDQEIVVAVGIRRGDGGQALRGAQLDGLADADLVEQPLSAGPDVTAAASAVPNVGGGNAVYHGPVTSSHLRASAQVVSS